MDKLPKIFEVEVHPTVLLSVVDHYTRQARGTNKRVVGSLLGEINGGVLHVTNSFAVPFEEDVRDPTVWFFDHNYHELLFRMFKKVNVKEQVVGWYSTGPKIKPADLEIHEIYRRYCSQPVYLIVDPDPKDLVVPTDAYISYEVPTNDKIFRRNFMNIPSTIGAYEAEEVGVEHLLRDLRNASTSTLATRVGDKLKSLRILLSKLSELSGYLTLVINNKLPHNTKILYNLQEIFGSLPDMESEEIVKSFAVQSNDVALSLYLGSIVRAIIAVHDFINNKIENRRRLEAKSKLNNSENKTKNDIQSVDVEDSTGETRDDGLQSSKKDNQTTEK